MRTDPAVVLESLRATFPGIRADLRRNPAPAAQHSILLDPEHLLPAMQHLRDHCGFDLLTNLAGIDWPDPKLADAVAVADDAGGVAARAAGFLEVVYHLDSTKTRGAPLVLRTRTLDRSDHVSIPSVVGVFRSAEFQEREVFDLFGIHFTGHPDLRRILMWDAFEDHPMRKDYVAPDDYEYEPTPHGDLLEKARKHDPLKP